MLTLLSALSVILSFATPASASPTGGNAACAVNVSAGADHATTCFSTFAAAVSYATGGRVQLANAADSRLVNADELDQAAPAAPDAPLTNYVLSIVYKGTNYSSTSLTYYGSSPCGSFNASVLTNGWNDAIQSIVNYSGCAATLYWNGGFGQPVYNTGVDASVPTLGSFNKQTSAIKWCPYFGCT